VQIAEPDFQYIRQLVYDQSSIHLGEEKKDMVCTRLNNRLTRLGLSSVAEYCEMLKANQDPREVTHLIDALSTHFTTFFREIDHFKFLKETIIPAYFAAERETPFYAWSAACSTGEEPYSMAIVLAECFHGIDPNLWQIFASDISTRVLEKASRGIYEDNRVKLPNPAWLSRYFQKGEDRWDGHFRVKQTLRDQIDFQDMNLLQPSPRSNDRYHLIFCRNVMIYFDQATARQLVHSLSRQLFEGGYLIVGHAENIGRKVPGLRQIHPSIFRRTSIEPSLTF
jgi:chemotaxis protein methyltransferase CheR